MTAADQIVRSAKKSACQGGMRAHVIKGFLPGGFCKFDVSTDLTAEYGLKTANEIADNAARANRNVMPRTMPICRTVLNPMI